MRFSALPLVILLIISCKHQTREKPVSNKTEIVRNEIRDSVFSVTVFKNISDSSIVNTSDRTIDILYNGVDGYLGGKQNPRLNFVIECMVCEPLQAYNQGFLFGKRLFVTQDSTIIYSSDRNIPDTADIVKRTVYYGERKTVKRRFSQGTLSMKYQGQSCMDADFVKVTLIYEKGGLMVNQLINASFFEFDLDRDGQLEQFLMGMRNCTQEVVVIRINNRANGD
jgi:hypothetical protein